MQDCTSFFSSFFFSLIVQSNMQRRVTILLKVTACLVFSVCFRRWSHSPVHFPTVLILHSECILVLSSCPIWHKAIKPKMRQTGLWICRFVLLPPSAARWQYVTWKTTSFQPPSPSSASDRAGTCLGIAPLRKRTRPCGRTWWELLHSHWGFPDTNAGLNPTGKILCEPKRKNKRQACLL